jgi:hypothetical protein
VVVVGRGRVVVEVFEIASDSSSVCDRLLNELKLFALIAIAPGWYKSVSTPTADVAPHQTIDTALSGKV